MLRRPPRSTLTDTLVPYTTLFRSRGRRFVAANFRSMPDDSFVVTMTDVTAQIKAAKLLEQSKEELEKRVDERTRELRRLNEILQDEVCRHEQTAADLERARKAAEAANQIGRAHV